MLKSITLKFGPSGNSSNLFFNCQNINVFVGPNNSGKSLILQEIEQVSKNVQTNTFINIIHNISFKEISIDKFGFLKKNYVKELDPIQFNGNIRWEGRTGGVHLIPFATVEEALLNPNTLRSSFKELYAVHNILKIDGLRRMEMVNSQPSTGFGGKEVPRETLDILFRDDKKRIETRNILFRAFNKYFIIDPTFLGQLSIRFSDREPTTINEEIGIDKLAFSFQEKAKPIANYSDGVKAYTGIISTVISKDEELILIDEPEAFLHPKLSFQLGKELGRLSSLYDKQFMVSSHSSDFLMGCIQSGVPINVIRLTYHKDIPTARVLDFQKLVKLLRNPLLRSANILKGIFFDFVVVTESDTDRAFYQEINERLLTAGDKRGIPDCLFVNAQNKQTVNDIIRPLRELGIPAATIVDIDIIKDGGKVWSKFLSSAFIPEITISSLATSRSNIKTKFDQNPTINMKIHGGIQALDSSDREACNNLFDQIQEYGLFVVRNGELESWLKQIKISGHGTTWLIEMFGALGEDPMDSNYIKPAKGDVWDFIGSIKCWFDNPVKKGIPD